MNFITLIILFGTIASTELMKSLQCSYVILLKAKRNVSKEPLEEKGFKYSVSFVYQSNLRRYNSLKTVDVCLVKERFPFVLR